MLYHRRSIRLKEFDYANNGYYFVTICVQNKLKLFWKNDNKRADTGVRPYIYENNLNDVGKMILKIWNEIPNNYVGIEIDEFCVMPNHIHGILIINNVGVDPCVDPHASKKNDTVISSIAGGWKSLDPEEFINYLVGFIDFDNSLKKAAAFCEVVIKSLSKETAESWLKTLEFLDSCCLDEKQYLVCYLLRARLQIDWHLHTAYRQLPYCGDWT